jgi:peptide/nickel transport system substrate-binding protein
MRHAPRPTRSAAALAVTAGIAIALAGCAGGTTASTPSSSATPVTGGTLRVALPALPQTIDPYADSLQADWIIANNACETLFGVTDGLEVEPVLAASDHYDGATTEVITLRSGVTFQDGEPLQAQDVVASLTRYEKTPGNGSILAGLIASAVATDAHTVTLTLKSPSPLVPTLLTTMFVMPASIQANQPATTPVAKLVCTGPYEVTADVPGQQITLTRYAGYTSPGGASDGATGTKHAYADSIVFTPIPASSTRLQAVETGQQDVTTGTADDAATVEGNASVAVTPLPKSSTPAVVFNKVSGVMANVKLRQAFQAALDMTQIMAAGFGDPKNFAVDGSIFPAVSTQWHSEAGTKGVYDVHDAAKVTSLLKEAGYTGQPITWLTTKDVPAFYAPSVPAQQELKKLGFDIDLQVVDAATLTGERTDPTKYDLFSSGIPTYADPLLLPYLQDTFPGGWKDPAKTALLASLASSSDPKARKASWDELQELVYQDVPFITFGAISNGVVVMSTTAHADDPAYSAGGGLFYNVWTSKK